jgi:hypothetical protein
MELRQFYFIIADISGYTQFVTQHRDTLLHAERIVGNLLEAVVDQALPPLQVHELLGDAVTFYAYTDDTQPLASALYGQMQMMREAFVRTESAHISECSLCACEACTNVGKLRLKVLAHTGDAAISTVAGRMKIAGEQVILIHRWLKNSIPSKDYMLFTEAFAHHFGDCEALGFLGHRETLEGLGMQSAYYLSFDSVPVLPQKRNFFSRLLRHSQLNVHAMLRKAGKQRAVYRNLPAG